MFEGVPVYADTTIEPYSELYVPLGSGRMRVYERRRERELAGTTGSHVPTFPVDDASIRAARASPATAVVVGTDGAVGTGGTIVPRAVADSAALAIASAAASHVDHHRRAAQRRRQRRLAASSTARAGTATVPRCRSRRIASSRWASIAGFPVYRDKISGSRDDIWVAVVKDGPLAPYRRQ